MHVVGGFVEGNEERIGWKKERKKQEYRDRRDEIREGGKGKLPQLDVQSSSLGLLPLMLMLRLVPRRCWY